MGLFDSLRGGSDPDPDDGPDAYRVVRKTDKGGWKPVDGFDEMSEPVAKDTFEYNASPLQPGEYRLFAVEDNLQTQPPDGEGWTLEVDGEPTRDDSQDDEITRLERKIDRMATELQDGESDGGTTDPAEAVEKQKASMQLAALQSDQFMKRHGEKIVLQMFGEDGAGGGGDGGVAYDDWQDNPVGASLFETFQMVRDEPEQIERLGEAIGRGAGSFFGAAADGYADDGGTLAEARAGAEPDDSETDDQQPGRDIDPGPSTMDDLKGDNAAVDTDELRDNIAEARTLRRAGPGEQDVPDGDDDATGDTPPAGAEHDRPDASGEHPTDALVEDDTDTDTTDDTDTDTNEPMTDDSPTTDGQDSDTVAAEIAGDL